jgi:hypothetical protein
MMVRIYDISFQYAHHWLLMLFQNALNFSINNTACMNNRVLHCMPWNIGNSIFSDYACIAFQIWDILRLIAMDMVLKRAPQKIITSIHIRTVWWPRPPYSKLARVVVWNYSIIEMNALNVQSNVSIVWSCSILLKKHFSEFTAHSSQKVLFWKCDMTFRVHIFLQE